MIFVNAHVTGYRFIVKQLVEWLFTFMLSPGTNKHFILLLPNVLPRSHFCSLFPFLDEEASQSILLSVVSFA